VVAATLEHTDPVHKVTVVPRGRSMGVTHQMPERDRYLWRREELADQLALMLGGRAAEALVFDTATSGAGDDLQRATRLARRMVERWGMSPSLGPLTSTSSEEVFLGEQITRSREHSEATARAIDDEVRRILDEAVRRATDTLRAHRAALDHVAERLLEEEEIPGKVVLDAIDAGASPA